MAHEPPRPPRPGALRAPLIKALSEATGGQPHVFVQHGPILDATIREMGYDPESLPDGWYRKSPPGGGAGLNRNITLAFRYAYRDKKPPLTVKGPKAGMWGLTPAGIEFAREITPTQVDDTPETSHNPPNRPLGAPDRVQMGNETAEWLAEHLTPSKGQLSSDLYRMMRAALSRRLPVSASREMVEDHIQNFMVRAIRRNAFRKLLRSGKPIPYSKVIAYAVNSGRTDVRDMGTKPVCRELFGARTEHERQRVSGSGGTEDTPPTRPQRVWDTDGNIIPGEGVVILDDEALDFDSVWERIENIIQERKPQASDRYINIIAMKAKGWSTREIAEHEGVSRNRAASLIAEARRCVREGYTKGELEGYL